VAYSNDGTVVSHVIGESQRAWVGRSVDDYIEHLRKDEEFASPKKRRCIDMAVWLLATESNDGPINTTIQITLPPSSVTAFSNYQSQLLNQARAVAMGLPGAKMVDTPFQFYLIREAASKGTEMKWNKLRISQTLPAKI